MRYLLVLALLGLIVAGCATTPAPDPITMDEIVTLSEGGADSIALREALETRPLGFPLTYASLKELEGRGVPAPVLDAIVALSVDRRARAIAPRYSGWAYDPWYDPWYGPWPGWCVGVGYHYHR